MGGAALAFHLFGVFGSRTSDDYVISRPIRAVIVRRRVTNIIVTASFRHARASFNVREG
jgi:hypothetical protein